MSLIIEFGNTTLKENFYDLFLTNKDKTIVKIDNDSNKCVVYLHGSSEGELGDLFYYDLTLEATSELFFGGYDQIYICSCHPEKVTLNVGNLLTSVIDKNEDLDSIMIYSIRSDFDSNVDTCDISIINSFKYPEDITPAEYVGLSQLKYFEQSTENGVKKTWSKPLSKIIESRRVRKLDKKSWSKLRNDPKYNCLIIRHENLWKDKAAMSGRIGNIQAKRIIYPR